MNPPERMLFNEGARGDLIRGLQLELAKRKLYTAAVDGDYGDHTSRAIRAFRRAQQLAPGTQVDGSTWKALTARPVPTVRDRALQVTAAFEDHGFTLAQGNFDGAGITWGVIGFTLKSGNIPRIVLEVHATHPHLVEAAFGAKTSELLTILHASWARQLAFANSVSLGASKTRLAEPWRTAFRRFGDFPEVQAVQLAHVDGYFNPAKQDARALGFKTELGVALCFDTHVQNGGFSSSAIRAIKAAQARHGVRDERELRVIAAHAVADSSSPQYRGDVLSRKLTIATGVGQVHGALYVLRNWGLAEVPAFARPAPPPAQPEKPIARRRFTPARR